jgi:hypothetical protein
VHENQIEVPERLGGLVGTTPEMIELFATLHPYARSRRVLAAFG